MNVMFVKNNIANSANAPRLNEYLQSSIRHDFLNKSDVETNKLFCKTMIIKLTDTAAHHMYAVHTQVLFHHYPLKIQLMKLKYMMDI